MLSCARLRFEERRGREREMKGERACMRVCVCTSVCSLRFWDRSSTLWLWSETAGGAKRYSGQTRFLSNITPKIMKRFV